MKKYAPHLGHFSLIEACAQTGCPICFVGKNAVQHYLVMVLYDYVDDPDLREYLCNAWGYCHTHAWMLSSVERGNLLTIALMYHDILDRDTKRALIRINEKKRNGFLSRLLHGILKRKHPKDPIPHLPRQHQCPACELGHELETNALKILLKAFAKGDEQMQNALRNSDGLCFPHLRRALELTQNTVVLEILLTLTREKHDEVRQELREFIRKHDYRFQHEPIGDEKYSWKRAINLIVGAEQAGL
jgi:hypothetical protein